MARFSVSLALIFFLGATGAYSDDQIQNQSNPKEIPDSIVVTASRMAAPYGSIASAVTVITDKQIKQSQVNSVSELLRTVPGVDVVNSGGKGQVTSIFLRGANSHHTLVMIDGVKINDPSSPNGAFNFADLTVDNIQRVEILRGPQSVLYGSDAIGGVIQIFSKRGHGKTRLRIIGEAGSQNSSGGSLEITGGTTRIDYSVTASRRYTDGYSSSATRLGSNENDGYGNSDFFVQSGLQLGLGYEVTLVGRYNESDVEFDQGFGVFDDPNLSTKTKSRLFGFILEDHSSDQLWNQRLSFSYNDRDARTVDFVDLDHLDNSQNTHFEGNRLKLDWQHRLSFNSNTTTVFGLETEREEFSSELLFNSSFGPYADTTDEKKANATGIYGLIRQTINQNFFVSLGVRSDHHEEFGSVTTYRSSAVYALSELGLKIKGAVGSGFKSPSLSQLYNKSSGNTDLEPEKSESWEIGFEQVFGQTDLAFGSTYFHNKYANLIATDNVTFKQFNINDATSEGLESFFEFRKKRYSLRIDHTYTKSEDKSTGRALVRRPKQKASIHLTAGLIPKLNAAVSVNLVGERTDLDFINAFGDEITLEAYELVTVKATYQLFPMLELLGRIENLFDTEYEEVNGFGSAPISVYAGARINIL